MDIAIYEELAEMILNAAPALAPPAPPRALALDPALRWTPSVLVVGATLPHADHQKLVERDCVVEIATSFAGALFKMHVARWDVVAVTASLRAEGDGVRFVRSFKRTDRRLVPRAVADIIPRYSLTPFVILPVSGSTEYAVFETATDWSLLDATRTPLSDAILRFRPWN